MDDPKRKRFLWALALAWAPWVPTLIGLAYAFIGISQSKATGIAVVAGGIGELLVVWGIGTMVISQVVAIVWLARSFSSEHAGRNLVSVVSICLCVLMLVIVCAFLLVLFRAHH